MDRRANLGNDLIKYSSEAEFSKDIVLKTVIPATVKLKNTEIEHKTINVLYPKAKITQIYINVIEELKERGVF